MCPRQFPPDSDTSATALSGNERGPQSTTVSLMTLTRPRWTERDYHSTSLKVAALETWPAE